jgi:septal ring factor EnvC (AmiA/AmiB activator)
MSDEGGGRRGKLTATRLARAVLLAIAFSSLLPPPSAFGQDKLRQQRTELERIRQERAELERQMRSLQTNAHDLTEEVTNLDRRADATARLVSTLERQLASIANEVDIANSNMVRSEAELAQKKVVLEKRLVDIYKRGPMYTAQALLSAPSFGELVARYKYLHLLALRDRALVRRVEQLRNETARERDRLVMLQRAIRDNRAEKQVEEGRLRSLEDQQRMQLARVRQETRATQNKIARMRLAETQLTGAIAALEAERRRAVASARRPASAPRARSSVRTSDYGNLDWPVDGPLVYTFGREVQPNNTTIRWNGVGIRAEIGTPVNSVASGKVVRVESIGTYGLTVIVEHGGGDYSIYGSLVRAVVKVGDPVAKGQTLGSVGLSDPELPPHLHFEIRTEGGPAIDPATWLRRR